MRNRPWGAESERPETVFHLNPEEILSFWLDETGPSGWYEGGAELDREIRNRFEGNHEDVCKGRLSAWLTCPEGALAYIILTDQMPRNMFRGSAAAFKSDRLALSAAKMAIAKCWDMRFDEPARQFFYMPLVHSECLADQNRAVRLMISRMPAKGRLSLRHARAHREVIRRFGRFPTRNEALSRKSGAAEQAYLDAGGYKTVVAEMEGA